MSALTTLIDGVYTLSDHTTDAEGKAVVKEYRISAHFTKDMQAEFQRTVLAAEVALLSQTRDLYTAEEYTQARSLILARFRNGEYAVMSKHGSEYLKSQSGMLRVMGLLCPWHTLGEIIALLSLEETAPIIEIILDESFGLQDTKKNLERRGLNKAEDHPNESEKTTPLF